MPTTGPEGLTVRDEDARDHAVVHELVTRAFVDEPSVAELVGVPREDSAMQRGASLVAELAGEVVGHVMLTRGWVDAEERLVPVAVLSPLSVAPASQGQGIGAVLVEHALARATELGYPAVFLEGSPLYYTRHGFRRASRRGFTPPSPRIPDPAFQVCLLDGYEEWMTGPLVYPDVFWRMDAVGLRGAQLADVRAAMGH